MADYSVLKTDVLVIGFGGAGLRAALEASKAGAKVILVGKDGLADGGATGHAAAEVAGFNVGDGTADAEDSPEEHLKDIMRAAQGMASPQLARIVAEESRLVYGELKDWGVPFEMKEDGKPVAIAGCFSSRPRMHIIPGHGKPILKVLRAQLKERDVTFLEHYIIVDLIKKDGCCCGAMAMDENGGMVLLIAGATVLCAGGAGQLFVPNLYPVDINGDGYALAYRAGVSMINMEFMQAGVGILLPGQEPSLLGAWIWKLRPRIVDVNGREILSDYVPSSEIMDQMFASKWHFPFSVVDDSKYIEIAVKKEGLHQELYLDLTQTSEDSLVDLSLKTVWQSTKAWYASRGIKLLEAPVQITCVGHAVNGGVQIGLNGETDLPGLFAAGEVAGGPHGADRLGGNMLVTCQVFGRRAGKAAAKYALDNTFSQSTNLELEGLFNNALLGLKPEIQSELRRKLQEVMFKEFLIIKTSKSLENCKDIIEKINCQIGINLTTEVDSKSRWKTVELCNMLSLASLMVNAASVRCESRGGHYREDYPETSDDWDKVITCKVGL